MRGLGWMFWIVPMMFFGMFWGPFWRRGGWAARRGHRLDGIPDRDHAALIGELEDQRVYAESLESRLVQLEERLDFAERLLSSKREAVSQP
jgi:hypothetical protein